MCYILEEVVRRPLLAFVISVYPEKKHLLEEKSKFNLNL